MAIGSGALTALYTYTKMRTHLTLDDILQLFKAHFKETQTASDVVDLCESLLPQSSIRSPANESA
jgi:hypothetical protein